VQHCGNQVCHRFCKQIDLHNMLPNCFSSQVEFLCMVPQHFLVKHACACSTCQNSLSPTTCTSLSAGFTSMKRRMHSGRCGSGYHDHEVLVMQDSSVHIWSQRPQTKVEKHRCCNHTKARWPNPQSDVTSVALLDFPAVRMQHLESCFAYIVDAASGKADRCHN